MTPGIGHNGGPDQAGFAWRRHVWTRARADLLPKLPIEVVRLRVRRAQALGLPYKTYAGIRASSGHDLVGFLFSSNALGVLRDGQAPVPGVAARLEALDRCDRVGLAIRPVSSIAAPLDAQYPAPDPLGSWSAARDRLKALCAARGQPADRFLLVGDAPFERDWAEAMQSAGFLTGRAYFAAGS